MDELRRMTEYMVTPNSNTKDGSMKGSRADNKPKLITNIQIPKKEEKTSILFKKSIDNTENKVEQPVDESLDKMEKAMDNLENKMKISAFNLTNKSNKTMDEKSEITIAEQTLSKDAISNDIVITNKEIPQTKQQSKGWFGWFKSNNKSVEPEKQIKIEISTENPIETIKTEEK
ncbi:hypothetical protein BCR36DRAFT_408360 [Piromyces finnis]|uniref:Uncharacterized protein n=1 Tax=Piromyces finnis TaxID=1754191 RepID=A0A1Y1VN01_9FUNG|nr:hypothetical protein BCR36DRAFT_408360 [Piromyces finnis]|eukprot:ORX59992.1 hypothetical protein BCR36DRAFT_408360 [Piromyces finnis]